MIAFLAGCLAVFTGIAVGIVGELLGDEARSRLDQVPRAILRLAALRLSRAHRIVLYQEEWAPELAFILSRAGDRPVTRLVTGTWYALGILVSARRSARHLRPAARGRHARPATAWNAPSAVWWATTAVIAAGGTAILAMLTGVVLLAFCGMPPGPVSPGPVLLEQAQRQLASHGALDAAGGICLIGGFALLFLIVLACSPFLWLKNTAWLR